MEIASLVGTFYRVPTSWAPHLADCMPKYTHSPRLAVCEDLILPECRASCEIASWIFLTREGQPRDHVHAHPRPQHRTEPLDRNPMKSSGPQPDSHQETSKPGQPHYHETPS